MVLHRQRRMPPVINRPNVSEADPRATCGFGGERFSARGSRTSRGGRIDGFADPIRAHQPPLPYHPPPYRVFKVRGMPPTLARVEGIPALSTHDDLEGGGRFRKNIVPES